MTREVSSQLALSGTMRVEEMRSGDEVLAMVGLHERRWEAKGIAQEFGCARKTVRRCLREGGVVVSPAGASDLRSVELRVRQWRASVT